MGQDVASALATGNFGAAIKLFEPHLAPAKLAHPSALPVLLDRAACNEQLGLSRKALKASPLLPGPELLGSPKKAIRPEL